MKEPVGYAEPLIILGAPRSFTSLICAMVGQHPELYGVPELNLFATDTLGAFTEKFTGYRQIQQHGLLRTVAQLYGGEQSLKALNMARRWLLVRMERNVSDVYLELCRKVSPLRIVDKSPVYGRSLESLRSIQQTFPNAHYLHLVRNPVSQGVSVMNVLDGAMAIMANSIDYEVDPPVVDPQKMWLDMQNIIIEFLESVPPQQQKTFRGEDFLSNRKASLIEVCEMLGISTKSRALEAMLHPEDSPYSSLGPIGAHLGNDINFLRSPQLSEKTPAMPELSSPLPWRPDDAPLREDVIDMARRFGYE
jgi:hypothetical protein